jgi:prolyl oligopeptidase
MQRPSTLSAALALGLLFACGHRPAPTAPPPTTPAHATAAAKAPAAPPPAAPAGPPVARTVDVVETIFGVEVTDPYRWMEGTDNPELKTWLRAQGAYARTHLDALRGREKLLARIRELGDSTSTLGSIHVDGDRVFYSRVDAGAQLPKVVLREKDGTERVLLDPMTLGEGDHHASIDNFAVSPDGKLLAYNLARAGGEITAIHVMDLATGKDLADVTEHVWGEFPAEWLPDGKGFMYTQMAAPRPGVDPMLDMQLRLHVLGTTADKDVPLLGGDVATSWPISHEELPEAEAVPGTSWVVAYIGTARSEARVAIVNVAKLDRTGAGKTPWRAVAEYTDGVSRAAVLGDRLYLLTHAGASNRKVVSVPLAAPVFAKARVEVPEPTDATVVDLTAARDGVYVKTMHGGLAGLARVDAHGKSHAIALPHDGWISELATDPRRTGALFALDSWTAPPTYYRTDERGKVTETGLAAKTSADYSKIVSEEVVATSADGTQVPLSIIRAKDLALDGSHPAVVYGYGGYGSSINPTFSATLLAWLERGGVYAVCHVRGGSEKGYQWQLDGTHEHKMNGVHDFEACGQALIDRKLTTTARLFGRAGSMGGILIGRAITDRPDLFAAVNDAVGANNPVRILQAENGANQLAELGDPRTEAGFKAILEMDPYQHVVAGTKYPAVIFTIGLNDGRVSPWETGKMAARMIAATTSGRPVLVRVDDDAGHGIGSTLGQYYAERADVFSFFLSIAGDPDFQP